MYVCMYVCMYVIVKCGGIVGGGGTIKQFLLICLLIVYLLTYNSCSNIEDTSNRQVASK